MSRSEKALRAKEILDDPVFKEASEKAVRDCVQGLLGSGVGSLTAQEHHATMKGIEYLKGILRSYIADQKVRP